MIGNAFFATNYEELKNNLPKNSPIAAAVSACVGVCGKGEGAWQLVNRLNARHVARRCGAIMVLLIIPIIKIVSSRDCPVTRCPLPATRFALTVTR